jgi:Tol biopolymer transport system component
VRLGDSPAPIALTDTANVSESSPSWSPGRRITYAFAGPQLVGTGIALVKPDGSGRRVVVSAAEDDSSYVTFANPSWSTSRTRLIYAANWDLFVARNGQERSQLTHRTEVRSYLEPTWSPDGRLIAFTQWEDGIGRVYVMRSDGSRRHFIVAGREPAWTRDGASILVVEQRATNNSDGSQSTSNCLILHQVNRRGIPFSTTRALLPAKNQPAGCP